MKQLTPSYPKPLTLRLALCIWLGIISLQITAQEFSVRSFKLLSNDISAYIDPEKDLNQEACALIKIVGDSNFAFSTPLGIVRRRNDVGEIWIYLPRGSMQITIKHPQWGVLRDYRFPSPLESRLTYELVLSAPITTSPKVVSALKDIPIAPDTTLYLSTRMEPQPQPRPKRPSERLHYLLLADIGIHSIGPSAGIRAAIMRRHGVFLHGQSNFCSPPSIQGECNRSGIPTGESSTPYYTGHTESGRTLFLAGGIHRLIGEFCLYEGVGYGRHTVAWEKSDGNWLRNTAYSSQGLSAELGAIFRFKRLALSAGVLTIAARHWEATIGFGLHF